jgi:hypothetical protein
VETFAAEAPPGWQPQLDFEHDEYAWCTFAEAERRLYWPGAPEGLADLRTTLDVLRGRLLERASQRGQADGA